MEFGGILLLVLLGLLALIVWGYVESAQAKQQRETKVKLSTARAADIVEQSFPSLLWADASGPGDINKRRRTMNDSGPVISVDIEALPDGATHVSAWMSGWTSRYGMANLAGSAKRMTRRLIRRLEEA